MTNLLEPVPSQRVIRVPVWMPFLSHITISLLYLLSCCLLLYTQDLSTQTPSNMSHPATIITSYKFFFPPREELLFAKLRIRDTPSSRPGRMGETEVRRRDNDAIEGIIYSKPVCSRLTPVS